VEDIFLNFISFINIPNMLYIILGTLIGIIFGAIPGLTANVAMVVFMPLTFAMQPLTAMVFLLSIFVSGKFGGSISAILIGIPGTGGAAATLIDGYPLALKGHAKKAILMALTASTFGGIFGAIVLLVATPLIGRVALLFGPPEYFMLAVFGLMVIAAVTADNIFKGIAMGGVGLFLATIGIDSMSGVQRFTFSNIYMISGLSLLPMMIGTFAISTFLLQVRKKAYLDDYAQVVKLDKKDKLTKEEIVQCLPVFLRSSIIGTIIGAMPGAGANVSAWFCLSEAKRTSKHPEEFGHGALEGIAAPEVGNSTVSASSLIPLLTLGVPGGGAGATLIAALMMHGLPPGPTLLLEHGKTVYVMIISLLIINIVMYILSRLMTNFFAKVSVIPQILLIPNLIVLCIAGAFAFRNSIFDVYVLIIFGLFAYLFFKFDFPKVPLVLGFILGPIAESNLRSTLALSRGSWSIFIKRPVSVIFLLLIVVFIFLIRKTMKRVSQKSKEEFKV
jgi:putative tricarboxylic transport membrane protein